MNLGDSFKLDGMIYVVKKFDDLNRTITFSLWDNYLKEPKEETYSELFFNQHIVRRLNETSQRYDRPRAVR